MPPPAHGNPAGLLVPVLCAGLLLCTGCIGTKESGGSPAPTTGPVPRLPPPALTPGSPDLSSPPPKATPVSPSVDPIVGTWYAPVPDDLTFEFSPDGTFTERSPSFQTHHRTWSPSEEGEAGFYDATILDQWGYRKQVHILITSGTLSIKSMGALHRVG